MSRELKSLKIMGITFPESKKQMVETFEGLPYEYVAKIRAVYKHESDFIMARLDTLVNSVIFSTCDVCEKEGDGWDDLPKDWGYYDAGVKHYLMCVDCQGKYEKKHGQPPEIVREI